MALCLCLWSQSPSKRWKPISCSISAACTRSSVPSQLLKTLIFSSARNRMKLIVCVNIAKWLQADQQRYSYGTMQSLPLRFKYEQLKIPMKSQGMHYTFRLMAQPVKAKILTQIKRLCSTTWILLCNLYNLHCLCWWLIISKISKVWGIFSQVCYRILAIPEATGQTWMVTGPPEVEESGQNGYTVWATQTLYCSSCLHLENPQLP